MELFFILVLAIGLAVFYILRRQKISKSSTAVKTDLNSEPIEKKHPSSLDVETQLPQEPQQALENFWQKNLGSFWKRFSSPNLESIEEVLYTSDMGPQTVERLMESLRRQSSHKQLQDMEGVKTILKGEIENIFSKLYPDLQGSGKLDFLEKQDQIPRVLMIVGVNGVGKTTTIGKLAGYLGQSGKKVLVAAGDTFRAAAGAQLQVWSERAQVEIFAPESVKDPSALAYDAAAKAKSGHFDYLIVDTAGRLHTQINLMEELKKTKRVMEKLIPGAPHEVLIVLDANSGQNALMQAREFHQALGVTGAILSKMDGTAKGGVAVGLTNELGIPIKCLGIGESISDLEPFSAKKFVESIFGN